MGDLSQVPVITCLDVLAHSYPGPEAVFDLGRYPEKLALVPQARGSLLVANVLSLRSLLLPSILPLSSDYIWPSEDISQTMADPNTRIVHLVSRLAQSWIDLVE